jgi:hypothetical protein
MPLLFLGGKGVFTAFVLMAVFHLLFALSIASYLAYCLTLLKWLNQGGQDRHDACYKRA